jgi:hypothetical protein
MAFVIRNPTLAKKTIVAQIGEGCDVSATLPK